MKTLAWYAFASAKHTKQEHEDKDVTKASRNSTRIDSTIETEEEAGPKETTDHDLHSCAEVLTADDKAKESENEEVTNVTDSGGNDSLEVESGIKTEREDEKVNVNHSPISVEFLYNNDQERTEVTTISQDLTVHLHVNIQNLPSNENISTVIAEIDVDTSDVSRRSALVVEQISTSVADEEDQDVESIHVFIQLTTVGRHISTTSANEEESDVISL